MSERVVLPSLAEEAGYGFVWKYLLAHASPRGIAQVDRDVLRFFACCLENVGQAKGQRYQDMYVAHRLGAPRNGFFVDFGATNGVDLSNTHYLEKVLGWNGILAEPLPRWHAALHASRSAKIDHRCVWWESGKKLEFAAPAADPEYSTIAEFAAGDVYAQVREGAPTLTVDTVSLADLLAEHGAPRQIDYLSIDTEGSELDILSAFDFSRYDIRIITVEHNHRTDVRDALQRLLGAHGFVREFEQFSAFDDWYFHPERVPPRAPAA